jgi:hypothetical protein
MWKKANKSGKLGEMGTTYHRHEHRIIFGQWLNNEQLVEGYLHHKG